MRIFIREVQSCERTLYRVSRTILSSDADCCDAVQEALTRAWKHRNDVNPSFFKTWLVRILINECHNIGRRLKRVTPVDKIPDQPVWQVEETGMMEVLQNIKESWRIVLTMHELRASPIQKSQPSRTRRKARSNIVPFRPDVPFGGN